MHQLPVANARVQISTLTNVAQTVFAASGVSGDTGKQLVLGIIIAGGAAAQEVIFRAVDDSPEYFRVDVPATTSVIINIPFEIPAAEGMEVVTSAAALDVNVTVLYHKPGSHGLGS